MNAVLAVRLLFILTTLWPFASVTIAEGATPRIVVDCSKTTGEIRPLHGVNGGPVDQGGLIDLSAYYRAARFPLVRLHDVHWPNADVVDMHVVFPNPAADPGKSESYDFAATDDFLRAIDATGAKVIYRLGESIEHIPRKRHANPPKDVDRWAAAAVGIVRHYEEGFGGGPKIRVPYWEIWNEPDNRPSCWTGTNEEYFRLYAATARAIKKRFPDVKVGGPGLGNTGTLKPDGSLEPSPFLVSFLAFCRQEKLPLDFFSWHCYTNDPKEPASRARAVRTLLDANGFETTESHLNEWNYLPDNNWTPITLKGQGEPRRRFYERMHGAEGAAFVAATLIELQSAPVDVANYFTANTGGFGPFDEAGAAKKSYHSLAALGQLGGKRLEVSADEISTSRYLASSPAEGRVNVLISWSAPARADRSTTLVVQNLPWEGEASYTVQSLDGERDWETVDRGRRTPGERAIAFPIRFTGPGVALVTVRRE